MWNSRVGRRLEELEKRVAELEGDYREVRDLPVEWQDWLHKLKNVLARINQRARAEESTPLAKAAVNPAALRLLGINGSHE